MMYYLGDIAEVFAVSRIWEPKRYKGENLGVANFYEHWYDEVPDEIDADAEDMVIATLKYESGGSWSMDVVLRGPW